MSGVLSAPYVLEYSYKRSTGPVVGQFLTALREAKITGIRTQSGKVLVPPTEYDPDTGEALDEFVDVEPTGVVTSWAWIGEPRALGPLDRPFAWALVKLDGADTSMLHAVDAGSMDKMHSGMRVKVQWREQRTGSILDILCFVPQEAT
jgi:uncharacterized OB-fold protein